MESVTLAIGAPASEDEAGEMAALHAACFAEGWPPSDFAELAGAAGSFAVTARGGGTLRGFALLRTSADEAEILTLCVAPGQRRRGLGRRLVDAALDACRGLGAARLFLEVAVDNPAALALYRRSGFVEVGRRPGYYGAGATAVDALVLARGSARAAPEPAPSDLPPP